MSKKILVISILCLFLFGCSDTNKNMSDYMGKVMDTCKGTLELTVSMNSFIKSAKLKCTETKEERCEINYK